MTKLSKVGVGMFLLVVCMAVSGCFANRVNTVMKSWEG